MRIMAVDYGDSRTGLAICDMSETLASPYSVIHEKNTDMLIKKIAAEAVENEIAEIIVGNPVNMNGTRGASSEKCVKFADKLTKSVRVPVLMWDERSTTVLANTLLNEADKRGKKRKSIVDAAAAAVILEGYLSYRKNKVR
ncbi:MAG: Holliday junction resolvase RuvX [Oscillospiraceae bacterium]|nr:Holliday junction resolvase RuvX [Oscillospiraceae bacterium]